MDMQQQRSLERIEERHAEDVVRREGPADERLDSEKVVVAAPFSFAGSAQRIWPYFKRRADDARQGDEAMDAVMAVLWLALGITLITVAWTGVLCWYTIFGIWVIPYRLIRRSQRKRQVENLRQRELLAALEK
jgi:hypothetical protein